MFPARSDAFRWRAWINEFSCANMFPSMGCCWWWSCLLVRSLLPGWYCCNKLAINCCVSPPNFGNGLENKRPCASSGDAAAVAESTAAASINAIATTIISTGIKTNWMLPHDKWNMDLVRWRQEQLRRCIVLKWCFGSFTVRYVTVNATVDAFSSLATVVSWFCCCRCHCRRRCRCRIVTIFTWTLIIIWIFKAFRILLFIRYDTLVSVVDTHMRIITLKINLISLVVVSLSLCSSVLFVVAATFDCAKTARRRCECGVSVYRSTSALTLILCIFHVLLLCFDDRWFCRYCCCCNAGFMTVFFSFFFFFEHWI